MEMTKSKARSWPDSWGGDTEGQDEYTEIDFSLKPQATQEQDEYIEVDPGFPPPLPHTTPLCHTSPHPASRHLPPLPPLPASLPPPLPGNHPSLRHSSNTGISPPAVSPHNPRRVGGDTATPTTPTAALPSTPAATTAAPNIATATTTPAPTSAVPSSDRRKGSNAESTAATQGSALQSQVAFRPLPSTPTHSLDSVLSPLASGGAGDAGVDPAVIDANRRGGVVSPGESTESYEDTADFLGSRKQLSPEPSESHRLSGSEEYKIVQQLTDLKHMLQTLRDQLPVKARQQQMSPSHSSTGGTGKILYDELKQMKEDLEKVWNYPQEIIGYCRSTEVEMSMMRSQLNDLLLRTSSNAMVDENRTFLGTLEIVQVTKLLELLNMVQYQDKFVQECIDGGILLELNEDTLEKELGISGRLERMRLMRIIRGERSAKSILEGEYNYVALERK